MKRILVLGGGITGRLVQYAIPESTIYDWAAPPARDNPSLTRQFGTNYLWEPIDGLKCRSFQVITHVDRLPATVGSVAAYKVKIGKARDEHTWGKQFATDTTGWDLVETPKSTIAYNMRAVEINPKDRRVVWSNGMVMSYDVLISTIPMYSLISLLTKVPWVKEIGDLTYGKFRNDPIYVKVTARPPDASHPQDVLYVNYISDPLVPVYRYCDRFGDRHYESLAPLQNSMVPTKKLVPGKIHPIDCDLVVLNAMWRLGGIQCFGRYARWDPEELVHDTFRQITAFKKRELNG